MPAPNSEFHPATVGDPSTPPVLVPEAVFVVVTNSADMKLSPAEAISIAMSQPSSRSEQTVDSTATSKTSSPEQFPPMPQSNIESPATKPKRTRKTSSKPKSKRIVSGRDDINDALITDVCNRLSDNKQVRRALPEKGRVHIDRQLPFVCIYRQPPDTEDLKTESMVTAEASYIVAPGSARWHRELAKLVQGIANVGVEQFGAFLIVEVWAKTKPGSEIDPRAINVLPTFNVFAAGTNKLDSTVEALVRHLKRIKVLRQSVEVETERGPFVRPNKLKSLVSKDVANKSVFTIGVEIPPVYRNETAAGKIQEFPELLNTFRRRLGLAIRRALFEFTDDQTTITPPHYHVLGRRAVVKSVWDVDRQLASIGSEFDYLLHVTPINSYEAWNEFKRKKFESPPPSSTTCRCRSIRTY